RQNLTLYDKTSVLDFVAANPALTQSQVATHFRARGFSTITPATVSRIVADGAIYRERAKDPTQFSFKRPRKVAFPEVEAALSLWVATSDRRHLTISGDLIREKARRFAALFGIPPDDFLSLSNGWLESFKVRHGLRDVRYYGEAGSVDQAQLALEIPRLQEIISKYARRDVFNWDESGLYYRARPTRGLAMSSHPGFKVDKTRITVAFLANATGSEMPQPLIIGKARRPRAFKKRDGTQLGFDYWWNTKAWMTSSIFSSWLERLDAEMHRQGRHILLLVDNASSHKYNPSKIHNIRVEFLPPNMTSRIQPLDAGIIRTFKAHYRRLFLHRALDRDESGEADIYQINQLEAMHMIRDAWALVSAQTVVNCWAHTGILNDVEVLTAV
ncbi:hypothetical protein BOTBODRAFT_98136, partial [Botryobasidium botryosum FD-172 SS1]